MSYEYNPRDVFDSDSPFAGLTYNEAALKFLKDHRMRMTIRKRNKSVKKHSYYQWSFRVTKSNGKFLSSYYYTGSGKKPSFYDVLSTINCDMNTDISYNEDWERKLRRFFATNKVREDLSYFL